MVYPSHFELHGLEPLPSLNGPGFELGKLEESAQRGVEGTEPTVKEVTLCFLLGRFRFLLTFSQTLIPVPADRQLLSVLHDRPSPPDKSLLLTLPALQK